MATDPAKREALVQRIDAIEDCYEFLLAYAAQGRQADQSSGPGAQVREFLTRARAATVGLGDAVRACMVGEDAKALEAYAGFVATIDEDAKKGRAAIDLVLAQHGISSQMVDNFNASIHVRALLTDIFLIDEALKITVRMSEV